MKIFPVRAELFQTDGRTDGQTNMMKLPAFFAIFRTRLEGYGYMLRFPKQCISTHNNRQMLIILNASSSLMTENWLYQFFVRITINIFDINLVEASKTFL
jgi:hypothetical protein